MPLKPDKKYDGKIREGSYFSYSSAGNLAFNIAIECEDGNVNFPLWLTEKNRAKAIKTLENLGADSSQLGNQNYLDYELANVIIGKEISFGTKEDTYNGKTSVKVAWIGKRTDPNVAKGAANFFGGNGKPVDDNDIPF